MRDEMIDVSVIVPTRNREGLLADTIAGLFQQRLGSHRFEIIIVDNASQDGTSAMLREAADASPTPFRAIRLATDSGPAVARNVGVLEARGGIIAFTDSDCVPTHDWLRGCLDALKDPEVGVVQGMTLPSPGQDQPLFNHFIETKRFDGSFSTSNVAYRRAAVEEAGGFDPECIYWEDVDLGWRVSRLGWKSVFAEGALVHHQVLRVSAWQWLTHARQFYNWPAKAARYPEFRQGLFLGVWVQPWHAVFQAAVLGVVLGTRRREFLLLAVPYLVMSPLRRRPTGRWPALKLLAHFTRDAISSAATVAGSIRFRSPVL
jgi:GT2 family glycosyltransferase